MTPQPALEVIAGMGVEGDRPVRELEPEGVGLIPGRVPRARLSPQSPVTSPNHRPLLWNLRICRKVSRILWKRHTWQFIDMHQLDIRDERKQCSEYDTAAHDQEILCMEVAQNVTR